MKHETCLLNQHYNLFLTLPKVLLEPDQVQDSECEPSYYTPMS